MVESLDHDGVREAVRDLVDAAGIEALAICFLHSYANPDHEEAAARAVREDFPGLHVSRSAGVFGNMREYERWTTATMNAYTQPMFDRYIEGLEHGLSRLGFAGQLHIMTSSGASITPETARRFPVRALESGPAAGALMSAHHGRQLEIPDLLSFDMGGTTAKGALIRRYAPLKQYDLEVGRVHEFKPGSGLPVKLPVIDMIEIGSGGGSLAVVDERGLIRVGPRSAGADPGPACYAKGGTGATLTDANVVLGYLDPDSFLGGEMRLDAAAARTAIERHVAEPAGLDPIRAAWGVHEIANEDVARAFRIHASERGFDYRELVHGRVRWVGPRAASLAIARKLRIPRVVFPIGAGVMSALGLLVSPLGFEVSRSRRVFVADLDADGFDRPSPPSSKRPPGSCAVPEWRTRPSSAAWTALPGSGLRNRGDPPRGRRERRPPAGLPTSRRAVSRKVRRDLLRDVPRRTARDRELEGGGGGRRSPPRLPRAPERRARGKRRSRGGVVRGRPARMRGDRPLRSRAGHGDRRSGGGRRGRVHLRARPRRPRNGRRAANLVAELSTTGDDT